MKSLKLCTIALAALALASSAKAQPRPAAPTGLKILRDLAYVDHGHERNRLDLYLPAKVPESAAAPLPVVVWIHGGAWQAGNKDRCPAVWLVGKGYAVASINYRLSQHAVFPAQIEDCKAAIRWLRANAAKHYLDPDRIGVWGESAGGHLVALLGTTGGAKELEGNGGNAKQSSRVKCVVDWFGPTDMVSIVGPDEKPDGPVEKLIGGPVKENLDKAKKASPLTYVSKDSAPFLIMHGDKDPLVPLKQSEVLADALAKAGVEVKLQVIKNNGHGGPGFNTPESRKLIEEFFDKHLKVKERGKTSMTTLKPRVLVTISKETTYITGPLRKDGYVNYVAALNERFKKGATPENNSAVLFWQAIGPGEIVPELRAQYFKMLDMQPLPEKGNYLILFGKFMQQLKDSTDPRLPKPTAEKPDPTWDLLQDAMRRPWSAKEFPLLAEWLAANEKPLALLVKATKRVRRYEPLLCVDGEQGNVLAILLDGPQQSREVGRALTARAMLRLKDGKVDEAWDDLLACHRLARLEGQGPTIIETLVAIALDGIACGGDQAVLQTAPLRPSQIKKMREDLARLPPMPTMADSIDVSERFTFLNCVEDGACKGFGSISSMEAGPSRKSESASESWLEKTARESLDWDLILRMGNSWYDRTVAACRLLPGSERSAALVKFDKDVKKLVAEAKDWKSLGMSILLGTRRQVASEKIGDILVGLLLPALSAAVKAEDRGIMRSKVTNLGFVLASYHADHGQYPTKLSELVPRYVAKAPVDIFANEGPLHYKRQGAGYLLYSVGINGKDDGGRGYDDRKADEDWDDISIRVP